MRALHDIDVFPGGVSLLQLVKTGNAQHSHVTPRWGTDPEYIAMSRVALGGHIELDPMSSPEFNETVQAERFYTEDDDCFDHPWVAETLFLNPAGGQVVKAWGKLCEEYYANRVQQAIWIGFSVEQLCQLASAKIHPLDFSWLLPRKRMRHVRHDGYVGSPSHSNYVIGMGISHNVFAAAFDGRGKIGRGTLAYTERPTREAFTDAMRRFMVGSVR